MKSFYALVRSLALILGITCAAHAQTTPANGFALAYVLQSDASTISVPEGGSILFPPIPVGTNLGANVFAANRGTAALTINNISLIPSGTSSDFQLIGLPLLPLNVAASQAAAFSIRYTPRSRGNHSATLTIAFPDRTLSYQVVGSSTGVQFTYELIEGTTSVPLTPNAATALPDTAAGTTRTLTVRVTNNGDADGIIQQIAVLGPGFQVADLPFLPVVVPAGTSVFFTLNVTPVQPGPSIGRIRIGSDNFELRVNGLGPSLAYGYQVGDITVPVQPNGIVSFSPTVLGRQAGVNFTVTNNGTAEALVAGITTTSQNEYSVIDLPPLPQKLQPNESLSFRVNFSPNSTGPINSTLLIDSQQFNLRGFGASPPDLPGYRFTGPGGIVEPLQQVQVGLTLDTPYPLTVNGTMTTTFVSSSFGVDPALQFATGGRTVSFRIPANSTTAIFQNNSTLIGLQTGTVAGTIIITANFTVGTNFQLPTPATELRLTIPAREPGVLSVEIGPQSNAGFTVFVTGHSTTRTLSRLTLRFAEAGGTTLQGGEVNADIGSSSTVWFRGTNSQSFGGLFTLAVPIQVHGLDPSRTVSQVIDSVSATLSNEVGTSNAVSSKIP